MVDGEFERLCVLFNVAALMAQIGNEANLQTDDGLKTAAKYFQVNDYSIYAVVMQIIYSIMYLLWIDIVRTLVAC